MLPVRRSSWVLDTSLSFVIGVASAQALAAAPSGPGALYAIGTAEGSAISLHGCVNGQALARTSLASPLAAAPELARDGSALYAVTRARELIRYGVSTLREQARASLDFEPAAIAASSGADAIVLVGGRGHDALSAHDAVTLAESMRYRLPEAFSVTAILDLALRRRMVVAFGDLDEAWEIAYDRDAPPVLQGLVHDYRMGEAIALPGRLTPRRFKLPGATRALVPAADANRLARIDIAGRLGIVDLEVRREIEHPPTPPLTPSAQLAPWRSASRQGWLIADAGSEQATVLDAASWRIAGHMAAGGRILALTSWGEQVLVAHATTNGLVVSSFDPTTHTVKQLRAAAPEAPAPLRFVTGSGGCIALLDHDQRWLAGFVMPAGSRAPIR